MVYYTCEKCGYTTPHKGKYERHLKRKNPCILGDSNMITTLQNPPKWENTPSKTLQLPPKCLQNPPKSMGIESDLGCIYCGKVFKRKDNLTRHIRDRCKIMKSQMTLIESKHSSLIDKNIELVTKTKELEKKVEQLNIDLINKPQQINTTINTQNIKINNYGKENLDYLTPEKINKLIEAPYTSIPKLIEEVHYHPDHPENNNMKITNKRQPYIKLLKDNIWKVDNMKRVIEDLIDKGKLILDKFRDEVLHSEFKNTCYEDFSHRLEGDDKELIKQMISDLELLIINNS